MQKLVGILQDQDNYFNSAQSKIGEINVTRTQLRFLAKFLKNEDLEKLEEKFDSAQDSEEAQNAFDDDLDVNFALFKQKIAAKMKELKHIIKCIFDATSQNSEVIKETNCYIGKTQISQQYLHKMVTLLCLAFDEREGAFQHEKLEETIIRLGGYLKCRISEPMQSQQK